ncbi:MAG: flagellar hook-basal body protein [Planctomycetota bacterium]
MYYGIQLSASGVLASSYKADVLANNLANANTVGFKPDDVFMRQRDTVRNEDGVRHIPSNALLESLGGGVHAAPNRANFAQGAIDKTGNEFDLAIRGQGFLVVRDSSDGSTDALRLTRDGRLTRGANGQLTHVTTGLPVLDVNGTPISLPAKGSFTVDREGLVRVDGAPITRLEFVDVPDRDRLKRIGGTLYQPTRDQLQNASPAPGMIEQGAVEASGVNPIRAMMRVTKATKAVGTNTNMIRSHDRMLEQAINTFARLR